jgi:hypothetical protein
MERLSQTAARLLQDLFHEAYIRADMDAAEYLREVVVDEWGYDLMELNDIGFDDLFWDAANRPWRKEVN